MQTFSILRFVCLLSAILSSHFGFVSCLPLESRQSSKCITLNAAFDESCYSSLNLPDFLTNPTNGWNATRGQPCVSGDNATYCCRTTEETWSGCFIRQSIELAANFSCSFTKSRNCPTTMYAIVPEIASANQRKHQYILHNIYSIYTLFKSWQMTLTKAIPGQINSDLQELVSEVDPEGLTSLSAPDVVQAYLLGLPTLGTPNASSLVSPPISAQSNASAQALLYGLQHAPAVAQTLLVNVTATSYPIETNGVAEYLSTNTTIAVLDEFLNAGLGLIMGDLHAFVNFTSSGLFSAAENYTLTNEEGLDAALQILIGSAVRQDRAYLHLVDGLSLGIKIP